VERAWLEMKTLSEDMSNADWEKQRRSFVYGNTKISNRHVTLEMVNGVKGTGYE